MNRPSKLQGFLWITFALCTATGAWAQSTAYPVRPVRMVIALAPGGGVDTTGRFIAQKLTEAWNQQVVADNRPGAGGSIAAEIVAKAPADGYTLLMTSSGISITPSIMKLAYDPRKDLLPVSLAVIYSRGDGGTPFGPGENREGTDCTGQKQTRGSVLLLLRPGLGSAPRNGNVRADDRHQTDPCALQGHRTEHH